MFQPHFGRPPAPRPAPAAEAAPELQAAPASDTTQARLDQLQQLGTPLRQDVITEDEFQTLKVQILHG